jgi:hypothetical protein
LLAGDAPPEVAWVGDTAASREAASMPMKGLEGVRAAWLGEVKASSPKADWLDTAGGPNASSSKPDVAAVGAPGAKLPPPSGEAQGCIRSKRGFKERSLCAVCEEDDQRCMVSVRSIVEWHNDFQFVMRMRMRNTSGHWHACPCGQH